MRFIATVSALFVFVAPLAASSQLNILAPVDKSSIDCGCAFFKFRPNFGPELYKKGREVLFFDLASSPPRALVNFGQGNVELYLEQSSSVPIKSCKAGEPFRSKWKLDEIELSADLEATVAGDFACWFGGELSVAMPGDVSSTTISGACQC